MRTTTSRFSAYVAAVDPNIEGRPATLGAAPAPTTQRGSTSPLSVLEQRYPAVVQSLTLLWGYPEMNQYFSKVGSGQDPTVNLDPAAMSELMVLAEIHRRICPQLPAKSVREIYGGSNWNDPWHPARTRG
jgi:hypothetical protein